jgi:hypothetical protein
MLIRSIDTSTGWFTNPAGDFKHLLLMPEGNVPTPDKLTQANGFVAYKLGLRYQRTCWNCT